MATNGDQWGIFHMIGPIVPMIFSHHQSPLVSISHHPDNKNLHFCHNFIAFNFSRYRVLHQVILDQNHLGTQFPLAVPTLGVDFPKLPTGAIGDFRNFASEVRRDYNYSDAAKCSQWPHLSESYEATYALKYPSFRE